MNYFEETKIVGAYDVDLFNRLKINSIFNYLQNAAALHADILGLGYADLLPLNLAWILSWIKVEIIKYPQFGDKLIIKTWPKSKYKLYSLRDFIIYDGSENTICKATTAWLPINTKSKRITDTSNLPSKIPYQNDKSALDDLPSKIVLQGEPKILFIHKNRYSDIDLNQHVNNTKYVELILDCFSADFFKDNFIKSIQVSFLSESIFGDELEIQIDSNSEGNNFNKIEAINKKNSKPVFNSYIEWT